MKTLISVVCLLLLSPSGRADEKRKPEPDRHTIIASLVRVWPNGTFWNVGDKEQRFDLVELNILAPKELAGIDFEIMLPHAPTNAALKEKTKHLVHVSVSKADFALHRQAGLFLLPQSALRTFKAPNQAPEPTSIALMSPPTQETRQP